MWCETGDVLLEFGARAGHSRRGDWRWSWGNDGGK